MKGKLFIISAPSGAGKTSLINAVLPRIQNVYSIKRVVTYTTKCPRLSDRNGHDYYFISVQEFEHKIRQGFFLEWSSVYGSYYGSPKNITKELKDGSSFILIIDRLGAEQVIKYIPSAILIWITIKDLAVLKQRLLKRNTEKNEAICKRLAIAQQELEQENHERLYNHHIVNDDFEKCLQELEFIIIDELKKTKK